MIIESEEEVPPVYVTAYMVAVSLGAMKPPTSREESLPGSDFVSAFGTGGTMAAGGVITNG